MRKSLRTHDLKNVLLWVFFFFFVDIVEDVPDIVEAHLQTAASWSQSKPAGSVSHGVQTQPGLYGMSQLPCTSHHISFLCAGCVMIRYLPMMR